MVDMEFETMLVSNETGDPDLEEEFADNPEPEEPKICCHCGQSFPFNEHMFECDSCPHFTCVSCRFIGTPCILCKPSNETLDSSVQAEASNKSLKDLHSMFFKRRKVNKDHIVDVELSSEEGSVQKQMCTVCNRVFKKSNARYHYMCATGEKPHECVECGQRFVKKSHLESHLNSHYGIKPFKCTQAKCKASFTQKDKLTRHMKSHNKETMMCPLCDKLYTSQDILNHHMIKVHSSTKQFRCDQCPRTYKYSSSLRIHRLKHQAKRDYMCELCGKKYALSAHLKLHKRSHVMYHRRPFKCSCGRRFISRRDKARHVLIHTSCHDFECSLCNTTFGRKDNLERHMKNFHQDGPPVKTKKVATVAPFNIKPAVQNKKVSVPIVNAPKPNKVEKQKVVRKGKPKAKPKQNCQKKPNIRKGNLKMSEKVPKRKSNPNVKKMPLNPTNSLISNVHHRESSQKQSVIVSPQQSIPQNRPSVIKSLPHLLPYRIIPPDKRMGHSQTPPSKKIYQSQAQTQVNLQSVPINTEEAFDATSRVFENPTTSQGVRRKIPKDDALNRCFRIIHHTDATKVDPTCASGTPAENPKMLKSNLGTSIKPYDRKITTYRSTRLQTRFSSTAVSTSPVYVNNKLSQEINQSSLNMSSIKPVELTNNSTSTNSSNIGGPSLPASFTDSVLETNQDDNLTNSYAPTGEAIYSASSYTPYFDSDYFRDSMNGYEPNVENLLPNDLDIGFQYINEQLGYSEMTLSSESRIIRYVSQETRIVRES